MEQNVKQAGYPDVQSFTKTYSKSEELIREYNNEMREWKNQPKTEEGTDIRATDKASVLKNCTAISRKADNSRSGQRRNPETWSDKKGGTDYEENNF